MHTIKPLGTVLGEAFSYARVQLCRVMYQFTLTHKCRILGIKGVFFLLFDCQKYRCSPLMAVLRICLNYPRNLDTIVSGSVQFIQSELLAHGKTSPVTKLSNNHRHRLPNICEAFSLFLTRNDRKPTNVRFWPKTSRIKKGFYCTSRSALEAGHKGTHNGEPTSAIGKCNICW